MTASDEGNREASAGRMAAARSAQTRPEPKLRCRMVSAGLTVAGSDVRTKVVGKLRTSERTITVSSTTIS